MSFIRGRPEAPASANGVASHEPALRVAGGDLAPAAGLSGFKQASRSSLIVALRPKVPDSSQKNMTTSAMDLIVLDEGVEVTLRKLAHILARPAPLNRDHCAVGLRALLTKYDSTA